MWLPHTKTMLFMACNSKLLAIISWHAISMKFNIGKKLTGLEIMQLNHEKNLTCVQTYRTDA